MLTVRTSENTVITSFRLISERQDFSSVRTGENTVRARARIHFCMEPCPEVHYLAEKLQGYGHHTKVIDGAAVKEYIKTHFGGQKTDLNDAQAIAFLSLDTNLPEITPKNTSNSVLSSIQAVREQFRKEYIQSFVSLKGICQRWGLPISNVNSKIGYSRHPE